MNPMVAPGSIYTFLKYCNQSSLEKKVLDCGAGGAYPPLYIFKIHDYKTYGIEIDQDQIEKAKKFSSMNNIELNIEKGDMTKIHFSDNSFSFLFSYNTTVHMYKKDMLAALIEFHRVLKKDGLCFINFLSKECDTYNEGKELNKGEFLQTEDQESVLFTHYNDTEIEQYLTGFKIIHKEKRIVTRIIDDEEYVSGYIDYILQKV